MSAVSSLGMTNTSMLSQMQPSGNMGSPPPRPSEEEMKSHFRSMLEEAGLDEEEILQVEEEIQAALEEALAGDDGGEGSHQAVKQAIDSVLEKHGIDSSQFQPPASPQGGPPPSDSENSGFGNSQHSGYLINQTA